MPHNNEHHLNVIFKGEEYDLIMKFRTDNDLLDHKRWGMWVRRWLINKLKE